METILFAIMLALAPTEPQARLHERARAIAAAAADTHSTLEMAVLLATIDLYETTLGRRGVPFGACAHLCRHHCGYCRAAPLADTARWALGTLATGRAQCGPSTPRVLGYYHHGNGCAPDAFSRREARTFARVAAQATRLQAEADAVRSAHGGGPQVSREPLQSMR